MATKAYKTRTTKARKKADVEWLFKQIDKINMCQDIDTTTQEQIAEQVIRGYELDNDSRQDWLKKTEMGLEIAKQVAKEKTFPWPGAANVRYPLIATAAMQFAARAYPQIINGADVVKAEVFGEDPDGRKEARAKRISQHMSWQVTKQMPEWEPEMDTLLHMLPVVGTCFKKTYFDTVLQRNRSVALSPLDVVVNAGHKGDFTTCRRITHEIPLYANEVLEREFMDVFNAGTVEYLTDQGSDEKKQELFLEQHCWYDLDGDGYEEPYIATVHRDSGYLCRLVANWDETTVIGYEGKLTRIEKVEYFTKYSFIPSPDGEFYDLGFAHLLGPINETISTLINQLLDAGALANTGGGFIAKGLRWKGGQIQFKLGEWKPVDATGQTLRDSIFPLPVPQPSAVLFQLLGLMTETGNKLASVSDAMGGEMPSQNTPATTVLAVIEQGLKVFTAIYKRVFRALANEYSKLYRLNSLYLDEIEYFRVLDSQQAVHRVDYAMGDMDVSPVADPSVSSEAQRLARAQALLQTMQMNPDPMGRAEILRQYYEAIGAKNLDALLDMNKLQQQMSQPPPPPPEMVKIQLETQKAKDENEREEERLGFERAQTVADLAIKDAQVAEIKARTMKLIAEAEAVEPGQQLENYKFQLSVLDSKNKADQAEKDRQLAMTETENGADQGGVPGVEKSPNDDENMGGVPEIAGGLQGGIEPGAQPQPILSGAVGTSDSAVGGQNRGVE